MLRGGLLRVLCVPQLSIAERLPAPVLFNRTVSCSIGQACGRPPELSTPSLMPRALMAHQPRPPLSVVGSGRPNKALWGFWQVSAIGAHIRSHSHVSIRLCVSPPPGRKQRGDCQRTRSGGRPDHCGGFSNARPLLGGRVTAIRRVPRMGRGKSAADAPGA